MGFRVSGFRVLGFRVSGFRRQGPRLSPLAALGVLSGWCWASKWSSMTSFCSGFTSVVMGRKGLLCKFRNTVQSGSRHLNPSRGRSSSRVISQTITCRI